ncbi:MAG TPA: methyltransferase domain-containing protein [Pirellulaceae bacterium]|nr:methyltransferase domain-containing protein [Pirellulaceae bacterium]HMO93404.1 methyltransferase domain-containing protein [Pirellulaceae bacterium]HMP70472.1 methyltransferase domain-containing protein [Pirellulaceae bacterium]
MTQELKSQRRTNQRNHGQSRQVSASQIKSANKSLGPVSDLERHLPREWWRTLFNSVYLKTDGDVVENADATNRELDAVIQVTGMSPTDRILDLCCGQGRHSLGLARRGYKNVVGVDRSRYLIRLARRRAKQEDLPASFHEGDARRFRLKETNFNFVMMMGNSFGYFDREEDDKAVLTQVRRVLNAGGIAVFDLADGDWQRDNYEPRSWEWIDQNHMVCRERSLTADRSRLISREVVIHAERGIIVDQFYAETLYTRERIKTLLEECGFQDVQIHDTLHGESTRNQDLGMMACRILVTAKSVSPPLRHPAKKPRFEQVTVLLGDPGKPDACKRNGQFNPEDFTTIDKLRTALGELSQFQFSYFDNHEKLIDDLREHAPMFVLNLCDEGFRNDAFKELHIPALLDVFGIPYSGAGPTTLGLCYNKSLVRVVAKSLDVPVPLETYSDPDDHSATIPAILPALVKPNYGDSSVGITQESVVNSPAELVNRISKLREEFPGIPILIQEFLTGNEYSVAVIGNPGLGFRFLPVLEVDYSRLDPALPKILGYESKWLPDSPYWSQIRYREASLDDESVRRLYDHSSLLFERLGCQDYARFDFRADSAGEIKLLEVNPNPGWCWDGKFNIMAEFAGLSYSEMLLAILEAAQLRCSVKGVPQRR